MYIPKNPSHHHHHAGDTDSSPGVLYHLINNPISYEIVLMVAVVTLATLMLRIADCVQSWADGDGYEEDYWEEGEDEEDDEEEEEAQPFDPTLTADGRLLDSESGGQPRQYGTFYRYGSWYHADGYVS